MNPKIGLPYQWLARSLKKVRKYDEAMRYYEKFAEVDGSLEARLDLAKSYRKGKLFEKSEAIYQKILKESSDNREARIGLAQILYATQKPSFLKALDELHAEDAAWLKSWLLNEFNFRIYSNDKTFLTPNHAAKFLGFKQIFELTQRAFKNELPSHFNPSKARLSFFREELENWATVMNRFECLDEPIKLYPEKIDPDGKTPPAETEELAPKVAGDEATDPSGKPLTKVEQLLAQIRARKAQRLVEQQQSGDGEANVKTAEPKRAARSGKPAAKTAASKNGKKTAASKNGKSAKKADPKPAAEKTTRKRRVAKTSSNGNQVKLDLDAKTTRKRPSKTTKNAS